MVLKLMTLFIEIILMGLVLSVDSFSAALAMGFKPHTTRDVLRFAFSSGLAEGLVAFLGAAFGAQFLSSYGSFGDWVSFTLIMAVSLHMLWEGVGELKGDAGEEVHTTQKASQGFHSYYKVLLVSFATSLDAFAVGVSLGTSERPLAPFVSSIAIWALLSTIVGMGIAKRASRHLGAYFSFAGALILMGIAVNLIT